MQAAAEAAIPLSVLPYQAHICGLVAESGRKRTLGALAAFHVTTCCGIATKLVKPGLRAPFRYGGTEKITIDWVRAGRSPRTGRSSPGQTRPIGDKAVSVGTVGNIRRMTFDPRYAIVTASDAGIGKATAAALAETGMDVDVTWHSDSKGADAWSGGPRSPSGGTAPVSHSAGP